MRPALPGLDEPLVSRFHANDLYRCLKCNAGFSRINFVKLLALSLIFLTALTGLTFIALARLGGPKDSRTSPRIRKDKIPQAPPPVFR